MEPTPRGDRRRVRSVPLTLAVVILLACAAAAWASSPVISGATYSGKSSQSQASSISVSKNGHSVATLKTAIAYDGLCGKRSSPTFTISASNAAIQSNGSFAIATVAKASKAKPIHVLVTGTFQGKTVSGTIAETGTAAHCPAPKQVENPYLATFTLKS